MTSRLIRITETLLVVLVAVLAAVTVRAQPGRTQLAVEKALSDESDLRHIEVSINGNEVTLAGQVETFWAKSEAIRLALRVPGVDTVASELAIPVAENDEALAEEVSKAVQRYAHFTIWDYIGGRINQGVVTLTGSVTPDRDKAGEIFERVAKIQGVQDVQSSIQTLSPSRIDESLRFDIARRLFSNDHFERFAGRSNPPFHIIVNNGVVTLIGYVQGDIERIEMQRIVGQTQGVLRVDNQLETIR